MQLVCITARQLHHIVPVAFMSVRGAPAVQPLALRIRSGDRRKAAEIGGGGWSGRGGSPSSSCGR